MNNLLKDSANNVFITSANILDKLTYKISTNGTNTVIPHNNESLLNPLSQQLKEDFNKYNQLLDDYNIELKTTEHVLNFLKARLKKDEELKKKLEEEQKIKKQQEAQLKLKAEQEEVERKKKEQISVATKEKLLIRQQQQQTAQANAQAKVQQEKQQQYNPADEDILDLDFGSFNFDQQVSQVPSNVGQPTSTSEIEGVLFNDNSNQQSLTPKPLGDGQSNQQGDSNMMFGNILGESTSMDALSDLNLDFLDPATVGSQGNSNTGGSDALGFDMGDPGTGLDNIMASIDLTNVSGQDSTQNVGGQAQTSSQQPQGQYEEDDGSLMPPDQMEHLFAQFDDLVQGDGDF